MGRNTIKGGNRNTWGPGYSDDNYGVAGYMRNGKFVGNDKLHGDYERRMRDEARAGLPIAFLGRMIGGRIARVGMKGMAKSAAKTAAKAAAAHVIQRQVEKAMGKAEGTAGRYEDWSQNWYKRHLEQNKRDNVYGGLPGHAHAGVIPLHMRIG